jgi:hypothetical protein
MYLSQVPMTELVMTRVSYLKRMKKLTRVIYSLAKVLMLNIIEKCTYIHAFGK